MNPDVDLQDRSIVIAGGSGFLGLSMADAMASAGADVTILSRSSLPPGVRHRHVIWDGRTIGDWASSLDRCDALINLAGRSVNCIKTPDHCDEILRSRVESTRVLGDAMRRVDSPPPVWVQMSTAHIYGDPPTAVCGDDAAFGYGLAPTVAVAWEAAFDAGRLPEQRGVVMRTSFVVGRARGGGGGALQTLSRITRFGLGGTVGSGNQGMSWIHEDDINAIFIRAIVDDTLSGPFIVSSPHPPRR